MSIMVDAGYLNEENSLTGGAVELFFRNRDDFIKEMIPSDNAYDYIPREEEIRNREEFPTFHRNWIDGIFASCIRILNHPPAVAASYGSPILPEKTPPFMGPVHDPFFVYEYATAAAPPVVAQKPSLDISGIAAHFKLGGPQDRATLAAALGMTYTPPSPQQDPNSANFDSAMNSLPGSQEYKKPNAADYLPEFPSDDFPDLDLGGTELSLENKQVALFETVAESFGELVTTVLATPKLFLPPIPDGGVSPAQSKPDNDQQQPGQGLVPIFSAAKLILEKNLPKVSNDVGDPDTVITTKANYNGLIRTLVKPLYLATIGVLFGSHKEGFTGLMGSIEPDAVKLLDGKFSNYSPTKFVPDEQAAQEQAAANASIEQPFGQPTSLFNELATIGGYITTIQNDPLDQEAAQNGLVRLQTNGVNMPVCVAHRKYYYGDPIIIEMMHAVAKHMYFDKSYREAGEEPMTLEAGNITGYEDFNASFHPTLKDYKGKPLQISPNGHRGWRYNPWSSSHGGGSFDFAYPRKLNGKRVSGLKPDSGITKGEYVGGGGDSPFKLGPQKGEVYDYKGIAEMVRFIFQDFYPSLLNEGRLVNWNGGYENITLPLRVILIGTDNASKNIKAPAPRGKLLGKKTGWPNGASILNFEDGIFAPASGHNDHLHFANNRSQIFSHTSDGKPIYRCHPIPEGKSNAPGGDKPQGQYEDKQKDKDGNEVTKKIAYFRWENRDGKRW